MFLNCSSFYSFVHSRYLIDFLSGPDTTLSIVDKPENKIIKDTFPHGVYILVGKTSKH